MSVVSNEPRSEPSGVLYSAEHGGLSADIQIQCLQRKQGDGGGGEDGGGCGGGLI